MFLPARHMTTFATKLFLDSFLVPKSYTNVPTIKSPSTISGSEDELVNGGSCDTPASGYTSTPISKSLS